MIIWDIDKLQFNAYKIFIERYKERFMTDIERYVWVKYWKLKCISIKVPHGKWIVIGCKKWSYTKKPLKIGLCYIRDLIYI